MRLEYEDRVETGAAAPVSIDTWLNTFACLLRVPAASRESIVSELGEHLRERVRDLMVAGRDEDGATRQAIEELGETADLARRFQAANRLPTRRLIMNLALIGLGLGVLGVGSVAVWQPGQSNERVSVFGDAAIDEAQAIEDVRVTVAFDDAPASEAFAFLQQASETPIHVQWEILEQEYAIAPDDLITLRVDDVKVTRVLDRVTRQLGEPGEITWRYRDGEIDVLDARRKFESELILAAYDVADVLLSMEDDYGIDYDTSTESVGELIRTMTGPHVLDIDGDIWEAYGGSMAKLEIFGGKMFVEAPAPVQKRVEWILNELGSGRIEVGESQSNAESVPPDEPIAPWAEYQSLEDEYMTLLRQVDIASATYRPESPQIQHLQSQLATLRSQLQPTLLPGDRVTLRIYGLIEADGWTEVTRELKIGNEFHIPVAGGVDAIGMTEAELREAIGARLSQYLASPQFVVVVNE